MVMSAGFLFVLAPQRGSLTRAASFHLSRQPRGKAQSFITHDLYTIPLEYFRFSAWVL